MRGNVRKLGRRVHLQGASRAGLQRLQDGVVQTEFLDHALAVRPRIHAKDAHRLSSVSPLVTRVTAPLCRDTASSPTTPHVGYATYTLGYQCLLPRGWPPSTRRFRSTTAPEHHSAGVIYAHD